MPGFLWGPVHSRAGNARGCPGAIPHTACHRTNRCWEAVSTDLETHRGSRLTLEPCFLAHKMSFPIIKMFHFTKLQYKQVLIQNQNIQTTPGRRGWEALLVGHTSQAAPVRVLLLLVSFCVTEMHPFSPQVRSMEVAGSVDQKLGQCRPILPWRSCRRTVCTCCAGFLSSCPHAGTHRPHDEDQQHRTSATRKRSVDKIWFLEKVTEPTSPGRTDGKAAWYIEMKRVL